MQILNSSSPVTLSVRLGTAAIVNTVRLYGCIFDDGSVTKTFTGIQNIPIIFTPPQGSDASSVAEVFVNGARFETYIVQNPGGDQIDPFYVANGLEAVKANDLYADSPMLYVMSSDATTIAEGALLSSLPKVAFDPLATFNLIYDPSDSILWFLNNSFTTLAEAKIYQRLDLSSDPLVGIVDMSDPLTDGRTILLGHRSGLIEKYDLTFTKVAEYRLDGLRSLESDNLKSGRKIFFTVDGKGVMRRHNLADFSVTATNATQNWSVIISDRYNQSTGTLFCLNSDPRDNAYQINITTLVATHVPAPNVQFTSGYCRTNSGVSYLWGFDFNTQKSGLYSNTGVIQGDALYDMDSYTLPYSADTTYQRVYDGSSSVLVGVAKSPRSVVGGYPANIFAYLRPNGTTHAYIGRRRKAPLGTYSINSDGLSASSTLLSYNGSTVSLTVSGAGTNSLYLDVAESVAATIKVNGVQTSDPYVYEGDVVEVEMSSPDAWGNGFYITVGRTALLAVSDAMPDTFVVDDMWGCAIGSEYTTDTVFPTGFVQTTVEYAGALLINGMRVSAPATLRLGDSLAFIFTQLGEIDTHVAHMDDLEVTFKSNRRNAPSADTSLMHHIAYGLFDTQYISGTLRNTSDYQVDVRAVGGTIVNGKTTLEPGETFNLAFTTPSDPGHFTVALLINDRKAADWHIWTDAIYLDPVDSAVAPPKTYRWFDIPFNAIPDGFYFRFTIPEGVTAMIDGSDQSVDLDARDLSDARFSYEDATNKTQLRIQLQPQLLAKELIFGESIAYVRYTPSEDVAGAMLALRPETYVDPNTALAVSVSSQPSTDVLWIQRQTVVHALDKRDSDAVNQQVPQVDAAEVEYVSAQKLDALAPTALRETQIDAGLSALVAVRSYPVQLEESSPTVDGLRLAFKDGDDQLMSHAVSYPVGALQATLVDEKPSDFEIHEPEFVVRDYPTTATELDATSVRCNVSDSEAPTAYHNDVQSLTLPMSIALAVDAAQYKTVLVPPSAVSIQERPSSKDQSSGSATSYSSYGHDAAWDVAVSSEVFGHENKCIQFLPLAMYVDAEILGNFWDLTDPYRSDSFSDTYKGNIPNTIKSRNLPKGPVVAYSAPGLFAFDIDSNPYSVESTTSSYVTVPAHSKESISKFASQQAAMQVTARLLQWTRSAVYLQSMFPTVAIQTAKLSSAMPTALVRLAVVYDAEALDAKAVSDWIGFSEAPDAQAQDIHVSQDVALVEKATSYAYFIGVKDELNNGYFSTELAALQNATNVWGMDPGLVFGVKQPSGLWTWAQAVPYTNRCGSEVKGYVSGG